MSDFVGSMLGRWVRAPFLSHVQKRGYGIDDWLNIYGSICMSCCSQWWYEPHKASMLFFRNRWANMKRFPRSFRHNPYLTCIEGSSHRDTTEIAATIGRYQVIHLGWRTARVAAGLAWEKMKVHWNQGERHLHRGVRPSTEWALTFDQQSAGFIWMFPKIGVSHFIIHL